MLLQKNNAIPFDILEIEKVLEIGSEKYIRLKPLETGSCVPNFELEADSNDNHFLVATSADYPALHQQSSGRPLVLSFYAAEWKTYGLTHLRYLSNLQQEISALGGDLLIISPDGFGSKLGEVIWDNSLELNFYMDENNRIAHQYGLYSDLDPAWNKYPGIEINVPLLATYVISNNKIVYSHIDTKLNGPGTAEHLLKAVSENYRSVGVRAA